MKKLITITIVLLLVITTTNAQINIKTTFDESVFEAQEKGNKTLFKRLAKGKLGSIKFLKKGKYPEIINEEGLQVTISASIILNDEEVVFTTKKMKNTLFPGPIFFPSPIFFPRPIFNELQEGNYKIVFNVTATNQEFNEMLRRRPSRIPVVFKID